MREFKSDEIRKVKNLDIGLLNQLLEKWRPLMKLYAHGCVRSVSARVDSSDVLQDALTSISLNLHQFRGSSEQEFRAWALATLRCSASNARRFHQAQKRSVQKNVVFDSQEAMMSDDIKDTLVEQEQMLDLAVAIDKLSPALKDIVVRRGLHQQDDATIAEETGLSPATVRVHWSRALAKLRANMGMEPVAESNGR